MKRYYFSGIFVFIAIFSSALYAEVNTQYNLRRCMLLPILGNAENIDRFSIYRRIEIYLKDSRWCYYRSNASILNMAQGQRKDMDSRLKNSAVLEKLATQTQSGSLIRVNLEDAPEGTELSLKIIGDNGEDVFFGERAKLRNNQTKTISNTVIDWLEGYQETIPYDGRILRFSEGEFLLDVGSASGIRLRDKVVIERPTERKTHPLLNEVVGWKKELIGRGKVVNVSRFQAHGKVTPGSLNKPAGVDDWVTIKRDEHVKESGEENKEVHHFGQLGLFYFGLKGGLGSDTVTNPRLYRGQRASGFLLGGSLGGEVWLTKNYILSVDIERNMGAYSGPEKKSILQSVSISQDILKLKAGYRFLTTGFFFGPQLDIYLGYGLYNYSMDIFAEELLGHHAVSGILAGGKGSIPFLDRYRGFIELNTLLFGSYEESTNIFGKNTDSITSYQLEFGASYYRSSKMAFQGSFEITSNKVTFKEKASFHFNDLALKGEVLFSY